MIGMATLTKLQKKQYREIVEVFKKEYFTAFSEADYLRLQDVLQLLVSRGYIIEIKGDNARFYQQVGNFADFEAWHKDQVREERKLSRREWYIAIISAAIGAFIGLLPTIISLFTTNG